LSKFAKENESGEQKESSESKSREETASLSRREIFHEDDFKYVTILAAGRERRSKFEELQAVSKNLERRLHEDDDYRRRQEMERRISKDKPPRYGIQILFFLEVGLISSMRRIEKKVKT